MHDGYLFTLGICGTASDASAAPALLDAMLGTLPPVKRAALLGDVRRMEAGAQDDPGIADALLPQVAGDVADAELLLIVTPVLPGGRLPARLEALLKLLEGGVAAGKLAALVCVAAPPLQRLDSLARLSAWCAAQGIELVAPALALSDDPPDQQTLELIGSLAREAYERASAALKARGISHAR